MFTRSDCSGWWLNHKHPSELGHSSLFWRSYVVRVVRDERADRASARSIDRDSEACTLRIPLSYASVVCAKPSNVDSARVKSVSFKGNRITRCVSATVVLYSDTTIVSDVPVRSSVVDENRTVIAPVWICAQLVIFVPPVPIYEQDARALSVTTGSGLTTA